VNVRSPAETRGVTHEELLRLCSIVTLGVGGFHPVTEARGVKSRRILSRQYQQRAQDDDEGWVQLLIPFSSAAFDSLPTRRG
jgi:hypothetical protein